MDQSQQLFDRLNSDFEDVMRDESERRRPGITAIYDKVRKANPTWSELAIATEAKKRWERTHGPKDRYGFSRSAVPFDPADRKEKA